ANDGQADSGIATVSITITDVNDAPVAVDDSFTTAEDTTLNVVAPGVLSNDSDVDEDGSRAGRVSSPTHGSLTLNSDGNFSYVPAANYLGSDSFTYKANDGQADSGIATVSITITGVNDAPVAVNDSFTTAEDSALNVVASGVLSNDSDVDGDTLSAVLVSGPAHGSLTLNSDGSFSYVTPALHHAIPSFTYKANDGQADSAIATVSITITGVNDAPVAADDSASTPEDIAVTIAPLANDSDVDGDP